MIKTGEDTERKMQETEQRKKEEKEKTQEKEEQQGNWREKESAPQPRKDEGIETRHRESLIYEKQDLPAKVQDKDVKISLSKTDGQKEPTIQAPNNTEDR